MRQMIHDIWDDLKKNPTSAALFLVVGATAGFAVAKYSTDEKVSVAKDRAEFFQSQMQGFKDSSISLTTKSAQLGEELAKCQAKPVATSTPTACPERDSPTIAAKVGLLEAQLKERDKLAATSAERLSACSVIERKFAAIPEDLATCSANLTGTLRTCEQRATANKQLNVDVAKLRATVKSYESEFDRVTAATKLNNGQAAESSNALSACKTSVAQLSSRNQQLIADRDAGQKSPGARATYKLIDTLIISQNRATILFNGGISIVVEGLGYAGGAARLSSNIFSEGTKNIKPGDQITFVYAGRSYVMDVTSISSTNVYLSLGERT